MMRALDPIPVTVVTGFLGAGKTSLINRLIHDPALKEAGFIINEFGAIGLDHLLVETADDGIVELSAGCLCCTVRGDLVNAFESFLRRLDSRRLDHLSRIVVETTGLADPAPVLHTLMAHPYLVMRYRLDGVITVVDALAGSATLDSYQEAVKQVAVADRLVLSKTDLLAREADAAPLLARLASLNPGAPVLDAAKEEATAHALFNAGLYNPASKSPDVLRWLNAEAYAQTHAHHHDHAHDVNRHDERIRAFCLTTTHPLPLASLEMFLEVMRAAHGPKMLRMKGIIGLAEGHERPLVIHGVQEIFHPPVRLERWPDADRRTRIVMITDDLPEEFVKRLFDAFAGALAPDTAAPQVLRENPLALHGFTPPSQGKS